MKKIFTARTFRKTLFGHETAAYSTVELQNKTDETFPYLKKIKRERHTINRY